MENTEFISEITEGNLKPGVIEEFLNELPSKALNFGMKVLLCIVLFLIGVKIIQLVRKMLRRSMEKAGAEEGVRSFVDSFVKAALYVLLGFVLLSWFGVDTASIVALVGSAGVAIGLAIQGSLSNLAGGVLIMLLKPFKVGDFIREDTHGNMGTVTEIQIFYTKLSTVDNQVVVLPNGRPCQHKPYQRIRQQRAAYGCKGRHLLCGGSEKGEGSAVFFAGRECAGDKRDGIPGVCGRTGGQRGHLEYALLFPAGGFLGGEMADDGKRQAGAG